MTRLLSMARALGLAAVLAVGTASAMAQDGQLLKGPQGMGGTAGQGMAAPNAPQPSPGPLPPPAAPVPSQAPVLPATQEACASAAQALYQAAESRRLADAQRDRLEELLVRMEAYCAAGQFQNASTIAGDIRVMIETN